MATADSDKAYGLKVAVIGESGAGKGTFIKSLLDKYKKPCFGLSTVNDYGGRMKMFYSLQQLVDTIMGPQASDGSYRQRVKNSIIIIDEAQVWLPKELRPDTNKTHKKFLMMLANARKDNNIILFIMHGFSQMPPWLPLYLNGIERFFTGDNLTTQRIRFSQFPQIALDFQKYLTMKPHEHHYIKIR